jgi:hypothetical protein
VPERAWGFKSPLRHHRNPWSGDMEKLPGCRLQMDLLMRAARCAVEGRGVGLDRFGAWLVCCVAVFVSYPSREKFIDMVSTPEYNGAHEHRESGLEATVLLACEPALGFRVLDG